jgi:hypothetical protein
MGLPAEGVEARMQHLDKENRALERNLAAEREENQQISGYLLAFHEALRGMGGWEGDAATQPAITAAVNAVPGLHGFIAKQKEIKRTRDNELRQNALSRMSREEAIALGLLDSWQGVNAVHEMIATNTIDWPLKEVPSAFADDPTKKHRHGR